MNWNFTAGEFSLRLPNSEQDASALFGLLSDPVVSAHIPRAPLSEAHQVTDELRRMAMRFEAREAAFWLVEKEQQLLGRIGISHINWMQRSAQLQWELSPALDLEAMRKLLPSVREFCFQTLSLHRLELRLLVQTQDELLNGLGFSFEGILPAQLEYQGEDRDLAIWSLLARD